ncbi:hypothetical protein BpHYR1_025628 [Brachionus plicatilis]|uniref:Uncharacterized protein n=1 Tax=Brachionus plicatilis TaxID=10195 RepID=A0A3M7SU67_BRAPC|nr:hypothetical protein BpHYR1_025628 [Brachionus plicatilis]
MFKTIKGLEEVNCYRTVLRPHGIYFLKNSTLQTLRVCHSFIYYCSLKTNRKKDRDSDFKNKRRVVEWKRSEWCWMIVNRLDAESLFLW